MTVDLDAIRQRLAAAKMPQRIRVTREDFEEYCADWHRLDDADDASKWTSGVALVWDDGQDKSRARAEFLRHAAQDVTALLDLVDLLQAEAEEARCAVFALKGARVLDATSDEWRAVVDYEAARDKRRQAEVIS